MSNEPQSSLIPMGERGVALGSVEDAYRLSKAIAASELCPKSFRGKPTDVMVAIMRGGELGFTPVQALESLYVVNGKATLAGAAMLSLLHSSGMLDSLKIRYVKGGKDCADYEVGKIDDSVACVVTTRRKGAREEQTSGFSVQMAKDAGLWGKKSRSGEPTPWITYPLVMLKWRAVGFHCNEHWGDVTKGLKCTEEIVDFEAPVRREPIRVTTQATGRAYTDPLLIDAPESERPTPVGGESEERAATDAEESGDSEASPVGGGASDAAIVAAIERRAGEFTEPGAAKEALLCWFQDCDLTTEDALKKIPRAKVNTRDGTVSF